MARRVDADHGDILSFADGYMTAWFKWQLQGDEEAARAFIGNDAEHSLSRSMYQYGRVIQLPAFLEDNPGRSNYMLEI